jgi:glycosyltransferase involved in cell wall biosynthesis
MCQDGSRRGLWRAEMRTVTVAIPTYNGAATLDETLAAVRGQRLDEDAAVEVLVCDSGSRDRTAAVARNHAAQVLSIPHEQFCHGETRNLLMERAAGEHVAFLSQDAVPATESWLERLLRGFALAEDVALVFGPYIPRADASPMVARELTDWFSSLSPDGAVRIDRLGESERSLPAEALLGRRGYFTDANGCVARAAWETVRFRRVFYAEDHVLAHDMLRAGFAKAYVPDAAVIHSHRYTGWDWLRRSFDESRALREVYRFAPPTDPRRVALQLWGLVGADWRAARRDANSSRRRRLITLPAQSLCHHLLRTAGAALGSRAERLPDPVVRRLSLEGRGRTGGGADG